jgi:ATP adenylyltransferase
MAYVQNSQTEEGCIFCNRLKVPDSSENLIVYRGERAFVILNRYPYTSGHLMIVPNDHQPSLELLEAATRAEMMELLSRAVEVLRAVYHPQGFNLGANIGEAAGAGVAGHVHLHMVPRWTGDTNFMSSVGDTRVLPEALEETYRRIREGWTSPSIQPSPSPELNPGEAGCASGKRE